MVIGRDVIVLKHVWSRQGLHSKRRQVWVPLSVLAARHFAIVARFLANCADGCAQPRRRHDWGYLSRDFPGCAITTFEQQIEHHELRCQISQRLGAYHGPWRTDTTDAQGLYALLFKEVRIFQLLPMRHQDEWPGLLLLRAFLPMVPCQLV